MEHHKSCLCEDCYLLRELILWQTTLLNGMMLIYISTPLPRKKEPNTKRKKKVEHQKVWTTGKLLYLLPFSKLPPYHTMNNVCPNWHIKNITSQYHKTLILFMEIGNRNHKVLVQSYIIKMSTSLQLKIFKLPINPHSFELSKMPNQIQTVTWIKEIACIW